MARFTAREIVAGALLLPTVIGVVLYYLPRAFTSRCGSSSIAEVPAPDRRLKVSVYERDCGATTDFATHVSLVDMSAATPTTPGNILVVDTDHGRAPSGPGGGPEVRLTWLADTLLLLRYDHRDRGFRSVAGVNSVSIRYEPFE